MKWNKNEGTPGEARMGNPQIIFTQDEIAKQKNVQIERTRPIPNPVRPVAAKLTLDVQKSLK